MALTLSKASRFALLLIKSATIQSNTCTQTVLVHYDKMLANINVSQNNVNYSGCSMVHVFYNQVACIIHYCTV